jgi:hypothetical protein
VPTFINPKFVHVETGGGGGGLVVAGLAVVAAGAAAVWVVRELLSMWVELAIIAGGTTIVMGSWLVWMAVHFNRGSLPVNQAAKADAIAAARSVAAVEAGTRTDSRQYHDNRQVHYHDNRHVTVHVHEAPAAEPRSAIAAPKVVPGVVLGATAPEAIEARKVPLHQLDANEYTAIEQKP